MNSRTLTIGAMAITGLLGAGLGVARAQEPDPAKVAAGAKIFEEVKCTTCHGPEGRAKDKQLSLVGIYPKVSAADIRKWIVSPAEMTAKLPRQPVMPMKKIDLTEAQVDALVAYVQSLHK